MQDLIGDTQDHILVFLEVFEHHGEDTEYD